MRISSTLVAKPAVVPFAAALLALGAGAAHASGPFESLCTAGSLSADTTVTGSVETIGSDCSIDLNGYDLTVTGTKVTLISGSTYKDLSITGTGNFKLRGTSSLNGAVIDIAPAGDVIINQSSLFTDAGLGNDLEIMPTVGQLHIRYSQLTGGDDTELTADDKMFLLHNSFSAKDDIRVTGDAVVYYHYNSEILFGTVDTNPETVVSGSPLDEVQ